MDLSTNPEQVLAILPGAGRIDDEAARSAAHLDGRAFDSAYDELVLAGLAHRSGGAVGRVVSAAHSASSHSPQRRDASILKNLLRG